MDAPAGYPVDAPPLPGPAMLHQLWADVSFLHWPVSLEAVEPLFPAGTRPDVFEGRTYVGLICLAIRSTGLPRLGGVPYVGSFLETNLRLYSVDDAGRHGVLFLSMDTSRLAIVPVARASLGLPYLWSRMDLRREDAQVEYRIDRRRGSARSRVVLEIGEPVEPTPLEIWLTARWGLHGRHVGRTWWTPNRHPSWSVREARPVEIDDGLLAAAGVPVAGEMLRPLFSSGVRTQFGLPRPL
jgi:uncharacterized protein YqjF (DUF2071 family)